MSNVNIYWVSYLQYRIYADVFHSPILLSISNSYTGCLFLILHMLQKSRMEDGTAEAMLESLGGADVNIFHDYNLPPEQELHEQVEIQVQHPQITQVQEAMCLNVFVVGLKREEVKL